MKKGCLIVLIILAVLLVVGVVGAFVAYNAFDARVGSATRKRWWATRASAAW